MKTKVIAALVLLVVSFTGNAQQKSKFAPQLDAVLQMFTQHDTALAAPVLAENYTITKIFPGMEKEVLPQVLKLLPVFTGYIVTTEAEDKEGTRLTVDFVNDISGVKYPTNFLILKNNKIQELNILESATVETKLPN